MKRCFRRIIMLPYEYGYQQIEMNIYKNQEKINYDKFVYQNIEYQLPIYETKYYIKWEGQWQEVTPITGYTEWFFCTRR